MNKKLQLELEADRIDEIIDEPIQYIRGEGALIEAVRSEPLDEFPMDRHAIDYSFGDIEIGDNNGRAIFIRDITDHLGNKSFDTPDELLTGLREALNMWKSHNSLPEKNAS